MYTSYVPLIFKLVKFPEPSDKSNSLSQFIHLEIQQQNGGWIPISMFKYHPGKQNIDGLTRALVAQILQEA